MRDHGWKMKSSKKSGNKVFVLLLATEEINKDVHRKRLAELLFIHD